MGLKFHQTSYTLKDPIRVAAGSTSVLSAQIIDDIEVVRVAGNIDFWLSHGSSTVVAGSSVGSGSTYHPAGVVEYINTTDRFFFRLNFTTTIYFRWW